MRENVFVDKDFIKNNFSTTKEYESFVKDYTPRSKLKFGLDKYSIDWPNFNALLNITPTHLQGASELQYEVHIFLASIQQIRILRLYGTI